MGRSPDRLTGRICSLLDALDARTDADLLGRFVADRDGDAFAALVRRHGPMVLGVCRRVLRDAHAAEDALQATFLVLARRAGAVGRRHLLANWLHGVAYRTASEARRAAVTRRAKEGTAAGMRSPVVSPADGQPDLRDLLDRELAALPDVYRAAIVLCDLEGVPRKEAAGRLGWAEGTLSGRLFRGRTLLAGRLSKYGLAVPAAALALAAREASAGVSAGLAASTARAGVLVAAGQAVAVVASAEVAALTHGVMTTMLMTKLKGMTAGLMVACAVTATGVAGWGVAPADAQERPAAGGRAAARDPDKDRIAQLERERQELLKLVAELRARVGDLEKAQKSLALQSGGRLDLAAVDPASLPPLPAADLQLGVEGVPPAVEPMGTRPAAPPAGDLRLGWKMRAAGEMSVKMYRVGELAADERQAEAVVRILKAAVDPESWQGGGAVAEYFPQGQALIVRQAADGHKQVGEVLDLLRAAAKPIGTTR